MTDMTKPYDGGSAFPFAATAQTNVSMQTNGMSLRDWFAGQALAGILSGHFADTIPHDDVGGGRDAAFYAYQYADAMLDVRKGGVE